MSAPHPRPLRPLLLLACVLATTGAKPPALVRPGESAPARSGPTLLVPARPDSAPPESAPAPFLVPGRPGPADSTVRDAAQRAREEYALGRELESTGVPGAAIAAYRNAVRFDPSIPDANYRMAMLFLTRQQVGEAAKCLEAEVQNHPQNDEATRHWGLCLARLGETTRAVDLLEGLARRQSRDGAAWQALGFAYLAAQRPREAETALRRALRLGPTTPDELRDLGAAVSARGRDGEARALYRRALKLAPSDAATWLNLGNLERRQGHADSALACYRRAEAGDSSMTLALQAQVQMLHEAHRDAEMADTYRRWLRHHPDHHGTRLEAVQWLEAIGREDEALALAREGTLRVGGTAQPHVILSLVLRGRGDMRGALAELRRAETLFRGQLGEQERVRRIIAAMRSSSPDSLRGMFEADSAAATVPGPR